MAYSARHQLAAQARQPLLSYDGWPSGSFLSSAHSKHFSLLLAAVRVFDTAVVCVDRDSLSIHFTLPRFTAGRVWCFHSLRHSRQCFIRFCDTSPDTHVRKRAGKDPPEQPSTGHFVLSIG